MTMLPIAGSERNRSKINVAKKTNIKYIICLSAIFALAFSACPKKAPNPETDCEVFEQVFPKVVDSTYKDKRLYTCFPEMGKPIYDKRGKWIGLDTIGQRARDLECEVKRAALKKDTLNLVIAVKEKGYITKNTDLKKYCSPKFSFHHFNELPDDWTRDYANWEKKYPKFAGVMTFSKINFDPNRKSGTIEVWYSCGGKCGLGYRVYLKKSGAKWIISSVKETSIS